MAEDSEKQEPSVYVDSTTRSPSVDSLCARTADVIFEQFEGHRVTHLEIIERRALEHVAAMEKDFSIVRQPDEPVALADEQRDNSAGAGRAAAFCWSTGRGLASRCRLSDGTSILSGHVTTSAAPSADDESGRRRRTRRCVRLSDGPR
jgi:hypothetical protein